MTEETFAVVDRLSDAIRQMQTCLKCSICLETMEAPIKTRCGHWYCRACIEKLVSTKDALCPLCKEVLTRRSIFNDERAENFVRKFKNLIFAIGLDTGIDILSHLAKPQNTKESCSTSIDNGNRSDAEQDDREGKQNHPGTIAMVSTEKKGPQRRSNNSCNEPSTSKSATTNDCNTNRPYLCNSSNQVSAIGPLFNEEPIDCHGYNMTKSKVQTWLKTIPKDKLSDPDRNSPTLSAMENSLDDTVIYTEDDVDFNESASRGRTKKETVHSRKTRGSSGKRVSGDRSKDKKETSGNNRRKTGKSLETMEPDSTVTNLQLLEEKNLAAAKIQEGRKPNDFVSEEAKKKSSSILVEIGSRDHAGEEDSSRASTSNMLPSTKKTWSSVVQFGKEMRKKKKRKRRLKSLNVSVESRNKSRLMDEFVKEGAIKSRPIKDTRQQSADNGKGNGSGMSENIANTRADNHRFEEEERLPNIEGTHIGIHNATETREEDKSPGNKANESTADEAVATRSPFVTLDNGERVCIRTLNCHQMNDIIGISQEDDGGTKNPEKSPSPCFERGNSTPKKHVEVLETSRDRSEHTPQVTPVKVTSNNPYFSSSTKEYSPLEKRRPQKISEIFSSPKFQSPLLGETPNRRRSSVNRRRSNDEYSNSSLTPNDSRWLAVKRDLQESMAQNKEKVVRNASRLPSERKDIAEENNRRGGSVVNRLPGSSRHSAVSTNSTSKNSEDTRQNKSVVMFKKLGRVVKKRRTNVKFLYLGSTKRTHLKNLAESNSLINIQIPSNPIETRVPQKAEFSGAANTFGNNERITLNDVENTLTPKPTARESLRRNRINGEMEVEFDEEEDPQTAKHSSIDPNRPEPSSNKQTSSRDIDLFRNNANKRTTQNSNVISQDTMDVLLMSLPEHVVNQCQKKDSPIKKSLVKPSEPSSANSSRDEIISGVKLLSPEKDSQLKFLPMDSPFPETSRTPQVNRQSEVDKDISINICSLTTIKGVHSRALIRKSQPAVETSESDGSGPPSKKRRRSDTLQKLTRRGKKTLEDSEDSEDESSLEQSFSSKITQPLRVKTRDEERRKLNNSAESSRVNTSKNCRKRETPDKENPREAGLVNLLDSDSDTVKETNREKIGESKKYKRVIRFSSDDTDSPDIIFTNERQDTSVPPAGKDYSSSANPESKRKRSTWDSEECAGARAILDKWCRDMNLNEAQRKKGGLDETRESSNLRNTKDRWNGLIRKNCAKDSSSITDMFNTASITDRQDTLANSTRTQQVTQSKDMFDKDSLEFNSIIDKVREIQRDESNIEGNNDGEPSARSAKQSNLMQDNFDEVIANVDTDALMEESSAKKTRIRVDEHNRKGVCAQYLAERRSKMFSDEVTSSATNPSVFTRTNNESNVIFGSSNCSNDENQARHRTIKETAKLRCFREDASDDDRTLTPKGLDINGSAKKNTSTYNRSFGRSQPVEAGNNKKSSNEKNFRELQRTSLIHSSGHASAEIDRSLMRGLVPEDFDSGPKETSFELDSLMNVTQHQLLIQQFEDDLFGKTEKKSNRPNVLPPGRRSLLGQETPKRISKASANCTNLQSQDVEHSGEEEDIVEGTPNTKTKNNACEVPSINSTARRNLTVLQRLESRTTSSPQAERRSNSRSSIHEGNIYPIYQSTPKVQEISAKEKLADVAVRVENKFEQISRTATLASRQTKEDAMANAPRDSNERRKLCFTCSGLASAQINCVKELAQMCNADYVSQFEKNVTHVIVKETENKGANNTLKYLQGIAHKKWVVVYSWVDDSLKEKKLVGEEPYEAVDSSTLEGGPRNSRLRGKDLFEEFAFLCIGPYDNVSVAQYKDLLLATGATVVDSLAALAAERKKLKAIIIQSEVYDSETIVVHDWMVQCVSQYKLVSLYPYLQELSKEDVRSLGYPEFLVEEDLDEDSYGTCEASI